MSIPLETIEKGALRLPEDQRITLAHRMLVSTEPAPDSAVAGLWESEILLRIEKLDSGQTTRHAAAKVFEELDRRLKRWGSSSRVRRGQTYSVVQSSQAKARRLALRGTP